MKNYILSILSIVIILAFTSCSQTKTITVTYTETLMGGELQHYVDGDSIWGLPIIETLHYVEDGLAKSETVDYRTMYDSLSAYNYRNILLVEGYEKLRVKLARNKVLMVMCLHPLESGNEYEFRDSMTFRIYAGLSAPKMDSIYNILTQN